MQLIKFYVFGIRGLATNRPSYFPSGRGALRAFVDLHFFAQDVRQHGGTSIPNWEDRFSLQDP